MLETIAIISNGVVIAAIGALYRKVSKQEEGLNKHIINFTKEIGERPDFDWVEEKIEKSEHTQCAKLKPFKASLTKVEEKLLDHLLETK